MKGAVEHKFFGALEKFKLNVALRYFVYNFHSISV